MNKGTVALSGLTNSSGYNNQRKKLIHTPNDSIVIQNGAVAQNIFVKVEDELSYTVTGSGDTNNMTHLEEFDLTIRPLKSSSKIILDWQIFASVNHNSTFVIKRSYKGKEDKSIDYRFSKFSSINPSGKTTYPYHPFIDYTTSYVYVAGTSGYLLYLMNNPIFKWSTGNTYWNYYNDAFQWITIVQRNGDQGNHATFVMLLYGGEYQYFSDIAEGSIGAGDADIYYNPNHPGQLNRTRIVWDGKYSHRQKPVQTGLSRPSFEWRYIHPKSLYNATEATVYQRHPINGGTSQWSKYNFKRGRLIDESFSLLSDGYPALVRRYEIAVDIPQKFTWGGIERTQYYDFLDSGHITGYNYKNSYYADYQYNWNGATTFPYNTDQSEHPNTINVKWVDYPKSTNEVTYSLHIRDANGENGDSLKINQSRDMDSERGVSFGWAKEVINE